MAPQRPSSRPESASGPVKSRLDKLGVKPDSRVAVLGVEEESFWRELEARSGEVSEGKPKKESDILFLLAESKATLRRLKRLQGYLKSNGALWVVWPKGREHIKQGDVMAAAKAAGLVDVKIVAFSETHSALKLVIPVARR